MTEPIEKLLIDRLRQTGTALCTVESCTGGLIAHELTNVPGASEVFWGSIIAYDNSTKEALVGVPRATLEAHGAVSREAALSLAENGLKKMQSALEGTQYRQLKAERALACVATTGIAGPSGGTPTKPVGLCWIGVAVEGQTPSAFEFRAPEGLSREQYKSRFAREAMHRVHEALGQAIPQA